MLFVYLGCFAAFGLQAFSVKLVHGWHYVWRRCCVLICSAMCVLFIILQEWHEVRCLWMDLDNLLQEG